MLYTTGYSSEGLPTALAPREGSEFIQKPYILADLTSRVRRILG